MAPDATPMSSAVSTACRRLTGGSFGTTRRIKLRWKVALIAQPMIPPTSAAVTAFGAQWRAPPPADLQHERRPHQGDRHERGHARRAAGEGGGPKKPAPPAAAISETVAGCHAQVRGGRLGPHRRARADGGDDCEQADRRQAPGESLLFARAIHHVGADVRPRHLGMKRPPGVRLAAGRCRGARADPVQNQHGD